MYIINPTQTDLTEYRGIIVEVIEELEPEKFDKEIGQMFKTTINGKCIHLFSDEIQKLTN